LALIKVRVAIGITKINIVKSEPIKIGALKYESWAYIPAPHIFIVFPY
jgi:hypothetical protein